MSEQELINSGFQRVDILNEDSQNGYDYYYYQKEICPDLVLYSTDNIDVKDNKWILHSFEISGLKIEHLLQYNQFLEIIGNITC